MVAPKNTRKTSEPDDPNDDKTNVTASSNEMNDPDSWPTDGELRVNPGDPGTEPGHPVSPDPRGKPEYPSDPPENTTGSPVDPTTGLTKGHPGVAAAEGDVNEWSGEEAGPSGGPVPGQPLVEEPAPANYPLIEPRGAERDRKYEEALRRTQANDRLPERFQGSPAEAPVAATTEKKTRKRS